MLRCTRKHATVGRRLIKSECLVYISVFLQGVLVTSFENLFPEVVWIKIFDLNWFSVLKVIIVYKE